MSLKFLVMAFLMTNNDSKNESTNHKEGRIDFNWMLYKLSRIRECELFGG